jgi:pimeloyl-ACP methyl ester carboxylesterase
VDAIIEKEIESRGYRVAYLVWGDGPPLVLVSGQLQAAEDWTTAGYVDALRDYRVIAVDPLGFGHSDKPHDPAAYRFEDRAADIAAVLDAEGVGAAILWGYSFGGSQVEAFARLRPDRTKGVVLGGMVPGLSAVDRRNVGERGIAPYESGDWATVWSEAMPFVPTALRASWEQRNDLRAVAASARASWEPHSAEGGPLPSPLLCYVGTGDWFWEIAQAMVVGPQTTFVALADHDHAAAFRDVPEVAGLVRQFLSACDDPTSHATTP